jgi:hypothetical protein
VSGGEGKCRAAKVEHAIVSSRYQNQPFCIVTCNFEAIAETPAPLIAK